MPEDKKEPQSYGSGRDWLTGDVGQTVNRQKGNPNSQHGDFYQSRHDDAAEGVRPSPPVGEEDTASPPKVTDEEGGTRRDSYFRNRDYE